MKWRYSRRIMRVRCILVETTVPVKIRPRIETRPVKGHFLSVDAESQLVILCLNAQFHGSVASLMRKFRIRLLPPTSRISVQIPIPKFRLRS